MTQTLHTPAGVRVSRLHRAWWIATVAGMVIVVTGASTGMPDLLLGPLRHEFGWSRGTISLAFAVNMALYGVSAPFAAALMDRFGMRRVVAAALTTVTAGAALTTLMSEPWELLLGWGLLVGFGTGSMALTFAATLTNRWFVQRRGLVSGILTSASMFGGMVALPLLAWIVAHYEWRPSVATVGLAALVLVPLAWSLLRDHPADLGMKAYGAQEFTPKPDASPGATRRAMRVLRDATRTVPFWLLIGGFGVCGASTNGIMMTHFVPAAHDHGMSITTAATLLAVMGVFNVLGATGSGWLTDRYNPPLLLAICYGLRGISLLCLPWLMAATMQLPLVAFVVGYGLLDLATVPPTITLCREFYGEETGPVVFGWVSAAHQLGAGATAFLGGVARDMFGSYTVVWIGSGALCATAVLMSLAMRPTRAPLALGYGECGR